MALISYAFQNKNTMWYTAWFYYPFTLASSSTRVGENWYYHNKQNKTDDWPTMTNSVWSNMAVIRVKYWINKLRLKIKKKKVISICAKIHFFWYEAGQS